jgi:hypothetical protein
LPVQVWHCTRHASYHHCSSSGHPRSGTSEVHGSRSFDASRSLVASSRRLSRDIITVQKCHMVGSCANMLVDHKLYVESSGPPRSRQHRRNCSWPAGKMGRLTKLCNPCGVWAPTLGMCCFSSLYRLLLGALRKYIERMNICFCQV